MWWAASEAVSPTLDNAVGCCWELGALSQQASAQGLYPASNVVADVFSEVSTSEVYDRWLGKCATLLYVPDQQCGG
jgi:hypothetical protein